MFFFFFKQKTAYELRISDWSSDVCSSDLGSEFHQGRARLPRRGTQLHRRAFRCRDARRHEAHAHRLYRQAPAYPLADGVERDELAGAELAAGIRQPGLVGRAALYLRTGDAVGRRTDRGDRTSVV